jgi:hypothetical protein
MMAPLPSCTCAHVKLGSERTDTRNWDPDCPAHGTESDWWRSEAQVAQRQHDGTRLWVLQTLARLGRQDRIDPSAAQEILAALDGSPETKEG